MFRNLTAVLFGQRATAEATRIDRLIAENTRVTMGLSIVGLGRVTIITLDCPPRSTWQDWLGVLQESGAISSDMALGELQVLPAMQIVDYRSLVRPGYYALTLAPPVRNVRRRRATSGRDGTVSPFLEEPSGISLVLLEGNDNRFHRLIQQPWANLSFEEIARDLQRQGYVSRGLDFGFVRGLVSGMESAVLRRESIPQPGQSYSMSFFPSSDEEAGSEPDEEMRSGTFAVIRPAGRVLHDEENDSATTAVVSRALAALRPGGGGVDLRSPPPGIVPFSGRAYRLD
jgi:hypothetical protein